MMSTPKLPHSTSADRSTKDLMVNPLCAHQRATDLSSELFQLRLQHGYTHSLHQHRLGAR